MRGVRYAIGRVVGALVLAALALIAVGYWRDRPQDLPWTPLDLGAPIGAFTGRKLTALHDAAPRCRALLAKAGVRFVALAPVSDGPRCGYGDGIRLAAGGTRSVGYSPAGLATSCPVVAALALWEWDVVQPAARARLSGTVTRIDHLGSYNCRHIAGSAGWSEHATADAVDIAGFRLADGTRVTIARDWRGDRQGGGAKAAFLRDVRDGACRLFATTLSPDYNAAHADHLHLDQAARGVVGWRACR